MAQPRFSFLNFIEALPRHTIYNRYMVEDIIGVGGFGAVLLAVVTATGQSVAVKLPQRVDRSLQHEARVFSALGRNPYTVDQIHPEADPADTRYLVLSLEGESLLDFFERNTVIPDCKVAVVCINLIRGLRYLHHSGVMHKDLAPRNVLLSRTQGKLQVILCDFGMSALRQQDGSYSVAVHPTRNGFFTPLAYVHGHPYQPMDDLYSMLYILLFLTRSECCREQINIWQRMKLRLFTNLRRTLPERQQVYYQVFRHIFTRNRRAGGEVLTVCYMQTLRHLRLVPGYRPDLAL